jgi:hypothetical protein
VRTEGGAESEISYSFSICSMIASACAGFRRRLCENTSNTLENSARHTNGSREHNVFAGLHSPHQFRQTCAGIEYADSFRDASKVRTYVQHRENCKRRSVVRDGIAGPSDGETCA